MARGLLRLVAAERPDAVVVDIRMPPTHTDEGLVAARQIRAGHPGVGVLVLSQYVEPGYAMRLIGHRPEGVGYLLKDRVFDAAILVDALRRIGDGECVIDPTIVARLTGRRREKDPLADLTGREREVLSCSPRACRTPPSPAACLLPSGRSRPTPRRSSANSGSTRTPDPTGGYSPSWHSCAPRPDGDEREALGARSGN